MHHSEYILLHSHCKITYVCTRFCISLPSGPQKRVFQYEETAGVDRLNLLTVSVSYRYVAK